MRCPRPWSRTRAQPRRRSGAATKPLLRRTTRRPWRPTRAPCAMTRAAMRCGPTAVQPPCARATTRLLWLTRASHGPSTQPSPRCSAAGPGAFLTLGCLARWQHVAVTADAGKHGRLTRMPAGRAGVVPGRLRGARAGPLERCSAGVLLRLQDRPHQPGAGRRLPGGRGARQAGARCRTGGRCALTAARCERAAAQPCVICLSPACHVMQL